MKLLLFLDVVGDIAGGGDVGLLHGDVHVVALDCLEHRLALVPTERLELHARLLHSLGALPPGGHFLQRVVLVLDDETLLTVAHFS